MLEIALLGCNKDNQYQQHRDTVVEDRQPHDWKLSFVCLVQNNSSREEGPLLSTPSWPHFFLLAHLAAHCFLKLETAANFEIISKFEVT
jgi:hypothetical protein